MDPAPVKLEHAAVLVTGPGGFVGRHLTAALAERGARVHGAGVGAAPAGAPLADFFEVDLRDPEPIAVVVARSQNVAIDSSKALRLLLDRFGGRGGGSKRCSLR